MYTREKIRDLLQGKIEKKEEKVRDKYRFEGTIFTSYFGKLKEIKNDDFLYIAICRFPPKYIDFKDNLIHLPIFAPSSDLVLNAKSEQLSTAGFTKIYNRQIESEMIESIEKLVSKIIKGHKICLLCYEKSEDFCHRHILCEYLNEYYGITQKEL